MTQDELQIQRRLLEGNEKTGSVAQVQDYDLSTFKKKAFEDSVFALPSYCHGDKPNRCPMTSVCALAMERGLKHVRQ